MITSFQKIDKHKSMLLIGIGATNKYYMEVVKPESVEEAVDTFGICDLTDSYQLLIDGHNNADIFLLNIEDMHDYLEAARLLRSYNFSYVVPIDVNLSSYFVDPTTDTMRTFYVQYLLKQTHKDNSSIILATDQHADLFEDIDAFLDAMSDHLQSFKANASTNDQRENIIFVANNISGVAYANVILARMILNSEVNEYPYENRYRKAIFDIDRTDKILDMAYFRNHADGTMSVENLLNLTTGESPIKIFTLYRICVYIGKELSFDQFVGSHYTVYRKQQIAQAAEEYLSTIEGILITDYKFDDLYAEEDPYHPGSVRVILKYSIRPVGSTERFIQRTLIA